MVYAYPVNITFSAKNVNKKRKLTEESRAIREYYEKHDFSVVKDPVTGKLAVRVTDN